jgi:SET domain-containing protein
MLLVKTRIGPSDIHGIGLFADEFISKGTVVWNFKSGFDLEMNKEEVDMLSPAAREQTLKYAYLSKTKGTYILCSDDARFFNHSDDPNTTSIDSPDGSDNRDIANRDIQKGDEITADYAAFDADCDTKTVR